MLEHWVELRRENWDVDVDVNVDVDVDIEGDKLGE